PDDGGRLALAGIGPKKAASLHAPAALPAGAAFQEKPMRAPSSPQPLPTLSSAGRAACGGRHAQVKFDPHSVLLRKPPPPRSAGERKRARLAAAVSSPPSIGGEVPTPDLIQGRRSGGRATFADTPAPAEFAS